MICDKFIESDGLAQLLRVQAARSPEFFLRNVSQALGENFVELVATRFRDASFFVKKNVSLRPLSAELPDIDLLIVSREPTLGYYVFACEVKATLPANWAKDYLRVLRVDSLPKAFSQVDSVLDALGTEEGKRFLMRQVFALDNSPVQEGLILIRGLIRDAKRADPILQDALVERGYDLLRAWCEAFVEQELLGNVSQRYRANIMMTRLGDIRLDRFTTAATTINQIFEKACRCMGGTRSRRSS
jgi:hypothetical protein